MDLPLDVFEVLRIHFAREVDGNASPTASNHIESSPTTEMWQQMDAGDSALPNRVTRGILHPISLMRRALTHTTISLRTRHKFRLRQRTT